MPSIFVVIPCGGTGSRAGAGLPKQYRHVAGDTVLGHTVNVMAAVAEVTSIVVAVSADAAHADWAQAATRAVTPSHTPAFAPPTCAVVPCAGANRCDTVRNGLDHLLTQGAQGSDWVLVHDAARCLITPEQVQALIEACRDDAVGGLLALRLPDTLKQETMDVDGVPTGRVSATLVRDDKWLAQTPQMFRVGALHQALLAAERSGALVTDEASAMELMGWSPKLVVGSAQNFKLTYPEDFELASAVLSMRQRLASEAKSSQGQIN